MEILKFISAILLCMSIIVCAGVMFHKCIKGNNIACEALEILGDD